jgi:hypothetical protein
MLLFVVELTVILTELGVGTLPGAVYVTGWPLVACAGEIVPRVLLPPTMPFTAQTTPIAGAPFATEAINGVTDAPVATNTGEKGGWVIVKAGVGLMVNVMAFDVPPPGAGFTTVTLAVPAVWMSSALTEVANWVLLTKVVVQLPPFHCTCELGTKFVPFTVRMKATPPAKALEGESEVIVGTGVLKMTPTLIELLAGVPSGVETVSVMVAGPVALLATLTLIVTVLVPVRPAIDAELVQVTVCPVAVQVQPGVVEVYETY